MPLKPSKTELSWIAAGFLFLLLAFFAYYAVNPFSGKKLTADTAQIHEQSAMLLEHWGAGSVEPTSDPKLLPVALFIDGYVGLNGKRSLQNRVKHQRSEYPFFVWEAEHTIMAADESDATAADSLMSRVALHWTDRGELVALHLQRGRPDFLLHAYPPLAAGAPDSLVANRARSFLTETHWSKWDLDLQEISRETTEGTLSHYRLRFDAAYDSLPVRLTVELSRTGALQQIRYAAAQNAENLLSQKIANVLLKGVIPFLIVILIIGQFFKRQSSRMIDLRIARYDSILLGVLIGAFVSIGVYYGYDADEGELALRILASGGVFLLTALFFTSFGMLLFSTADSLVQEAWPVKKYSLTYLRYGLLRNPQVGQALGRGLTAGAAMCLLYMLLLLFADASYVAFEPEKDQMLTGFGYLYLLYIPGEALVYAVFISTFFLLIPGSWLKLRKVNFAAKALMLTFAFSALSLAPEHPNFAFMQLHALMIAAIPVMLFLRYDNLSVMTALFVFTIANFGITSFFAPHLPDVLPILTSFILIAGIGVLALVGSTAKADESGGLPDLEPEYLKRLAREKRIEKEFELAREVHDSFLTSVKPDIQGFDIAASCKTAYEVGGDYFDFISLDEHRTLVIIADVSGKGVKAAFFMTLLKGYLQAVSEQHRDVGEIMKIVNRLFHANSPRGTFITALAGVLDVRTGTFEFARAGHDPLLLLDARTGQAEVHQPKGFALGMAKPHKFNDYLEIRRVTIGEGQAVVLFTDGYVESHNLKREQLGEKRLTELIGRAFREEPGTSGRLLEVVHGEVTRFVGNAHQHDDMTMVVLRKC